MRDGTMGIIIILMVGWLEHVIRFLELISKQFHYWGGSTLNKDKNNIKFFF